MKHSYYKEFRQFLIKKHGDLFATLQTAFFEKAVQAAENGCYEDALVLGEDAMTLAKYSNVGYPNIYMAGMLCQCYLDNGMPEKANELFKRVMPFLDENDYDYDDDVDNFLDLKIAIDNAIKNKDS